MSGWRFCVLGMSCVLPSLSTCRVFLTALIYCSSPALQRTLKIAIVGAPNAGKSTLTNLLVGTQVNSELWHCHCLARCMARCTSRTPPGRSLESHGRLCARRDLTRRPLGSYR